MLKVAPDYPEIQFVGCTNQGSWNDGLDNTHNAFANIYEGRYLAGVAAGMKLQQLIDERRPSSPKRPSSATSARTPSPKSSPAMTSYYPGRHAPSARA